MSDESKKKGTNMNRKWILVYFTIILSLSLFGLGIAGEQKANSRKGKLLFRNSCRVCHNGGKAQELGPYRKKIKEWESIFAKDKYKEYACKAEWEKLSEQDLLDILSYLRAGAADSKVPRGCG
jgi:mono/diheme cytochrome c family protein